MPNYINGPSGVVIPAPAYESGGFTLSTFVDGGRNMEGNFIGQYIADKYKVDINFAQMSPEQLSSFLALFDPQQGGSFTNQFTVFDARKNDFSTMLMYVGDRSGTPYCVDGSTGRPERWMNVRANLIEV